jgi:hypothetical protein
MHMKMNKIVSLLALLVVLILFFPVISRAGDTSFLISRTDLSFGAMVSHEVQTPPQVIFINKTGGGDFEWTCISQGAWLRVSHANGIGSAVVQVSVHPSGLAVGAHHSRFKITDVDTGEWILVYVTLNIYAGGAGIDPFGSMDTPLEGAAVRSSIPVTGWAIDDIGIKRVTIWRDAVSGEDGDEIFVGKAVMVDGARPDVEQLFPGYPLNYAAGWGYMLLTNMLPGGGNGQFKLHAYATDYSDNIVYLGGRTITCDNNNAVKPFGAIDTPGQGAVVAGTDYRNRGWVLTPLPASIPEDGSTIEVFIDGKSQGNPTYNVYRPDIAALFPGYANSQGALAYYDFDTTLLDCGVHTIQWTARDSLGRVDGIGSRYFVVSRDPFYSAEGLGAAKAVTPRPLKLTPRQIAALPMAADGAIVKRMPGKDGIMRVSIPQDGRVVLDLEHGPGSRYAGYFLVGNELRPLPVGALLDHETGRFYWQPGVAFIGDYTFVFATQAPGAEARKQRVSVKITPDRH